ncbi:Golgi-associated plant pathogenesis-related protein 1-like [Xiphias gladius]|uniref:Golgi-associated plant pathogenesis-related protein 1-like n=1 Tax=Xiphias gladius TaxID=8245 RepID=UPI001A98A416|nr:Golgi-associated plant pathogenesis-related protein 1-like [Xiphias gladius]
MGKAHVNKYQLQDSKRYCLYRTFLQTLGKHPDSAFITKDTMADASFQKTFLEAHNTYRSKHSTPPLTLSSELTASAQKWADHLLAISTLKHSDTQDGENVFTMYSSATIKLTGKEAVDSWYNEIKDYNWSSPGFKSETGHFTQVVWKDSTELGVGMATDGKRAFVVGQYRPAGNMNMAEYFEKNILPLGSQKYGSYLANRPRLTDDPVMNPDIEET